MKRKQTSQDPHDPQDPPVASGGAPGTRRDRVLAWTRPAVRGLKPYYKAPVAGDPLRLDQNTSLLGPNPALARVDASAVDASLYPSRDGDTLIAALAAFHGLPEDHFVLGNGSDEALDFVTKAFASPGETMAVPWPTYSLYPFYAALQDLRLARVPLRGGFRLEVDGLLAKEAAVTVVASPNNPTGNRFPTGELERLLDATDGVVVIDEAYIEYAGLQHSLLPHVDAYDNLVVLRTFSKAYALAGLRVGYLVANADLAERLRLVKPPFNLNVLSEQAAVHALGEQAWLDATVAATVQERERLAEALSAAGFRVHASQANFLLTDSPVDPAAVAAGLRERGILARTFPGADGLEHAIRFTVGRPEHSDRLLAALGEVLR